ncbi:hypothetical protein [Synergistes jonesii]|uniref:Bbp19 family protein n=1 Tax=Synergistes jonesii TaxID=2754 RepID=UPI00248ED2E7|nr:hypothetical protein [Synergistes jonesii]
MTEQRREAEMRLMSALLGIPEGRIFVGLLIEETGFLKSSARDSPTAYDAYYREGERNVGQRVFEMALGAGAEPLECMREFGAWCGEIRLREEAEEKEDQGYGGTK